MNAFRIALFGMAAATAIGLAAQAAEISGAGATFPYPIYAKWAEAYSAKTGLKMNYQSIGSGGGIAQIVADKTDVNVRMRDIAWPALAGGMRAAAKIWKRRVDARRMKKGEMDRKLARISTTTDWSGFARADVAIEAASLILCDDEEHVHNPVVGPIYQTSLFTFPNYAAMEQAFAGSPQKTESLGSS